MLMKISADCLNLMESFAEGCILRLVFKSRFIHSSGLCSGE